MDLGRAGSAYQAQALRSCCQAPDSMHALIPHRHLCCRERQFRDLKSANWFGAALMGSPPNDVPRKSAGLPRLDCEGRNTGRADGEARAIDDCC